MCARACAHVHVYVPFCRDLGTSIDLHGGNWGLGSKSFSASGYSKLHLVPSQMNTSLVKRDTFYLAS